jgi:hypothetical protein
MFESWFSADSNDAISILKRDHDTVKDLFHQFENAKGHAEKKKIVAQALEELKIHAAIEEEIFYPTVRAELEKDMMNEADEEHHVAKVLIAELEKMTGTEDHYDAKFTVLSENVRHHIKEEESEMLPVARKLDIDFDALGERLMQRKDQLRVEGIPEVAEDRAADPRADSSAKNAQRSSGKTVKRAPAKAAKRSPAKKTVARKKTAPKTRTAGGR